MSLLHHIGISEGTHLPGLNLHGNGLNLWHEMYLRWSELSLTQMGSIVALAGTLPTAWSFAQGLWHSTYAFVRQFFLASVTIPGGDPLNRHVVKWILEHRPRHHRAFTGRTLVASGHGDRAAALKRTQHATQYVPHWQTRWFWHESRLFLVTRTVQNFSSAISDPSYDGIGGEELTVNCVGWAVNPIQELLQKCRDFADKQEQYFVIIYSRDRYGLSWKPRARKPIRRLDTVHFDGNSKKHLVDDIRNYLDSRTQQLYQSRSMPYRRGYLFHGPPGTGKSSLSVAIAGEFGLDLYEVKIPTVASDADLEQMFQEIPPRCVVLLEDIDAVWGDRKREEKSQQDGSVSSCCTLSGLLNVLDGVGTEEGRIAIMTTNRPEQLDEALVRPGRIDLQVHLGNISPQSAEEMFIRMFSSGAGYISDVSQPHLAALASEFSRHIPLNQVTPSQLQGFFQMHLSSPEDAMSNIASWLRDEGIAGSPRGYQLVSKTSVSSLSESS